MVPMALVQQKSLPVVNSPIFLFISLAPISIARYDFERGELAGGAGSRG